MALPALSLEEVVVMDASQRLTYFTTYARHTDAPKLRYAVRVGSRTFYSNDTWELRQKMEAYVGDARRNRKAKEKRDASRKDDRKRIHTE